MRISAACLLLACSSIAAAQAPPGGITIKVVSTSGRGVQSKIIERSGATTSSVRTDANGIARLDGRSCAAGLQFKAQPLYPLYASQDDDWRDCEQNLTFTLRPVGYASALEGALGSSPLAVFSAYGGTHHSHGIGGTAHAHSWGGSHPAWAREGQARALQDKLHAAAEAGDWASIAMYANEQAALYRSAGKTEAADIYSGLAIQAGTQAITLHTGTASDADPLVTDQSGKLRESTAAHDMLKDFQAEHSIGPGDQRPNWDRETFEAIRNVTAETSASERMQAATSGADAPQ